MSPFTARIAPVIKRDSSESDCFYTFKGAELTVLDLIRLALRVLISCSIFSSTAWQSRWWKLAGYRASKSLLLGQRTVTQLLLLVHVKVGLSVCNLITVGLILKNSSIWLH